MSLSAHPSLSIEVFIYVCFESLVTVDPVASSSVGSWLSCHVAVVMLPFL